MPAIVDDDILPDMGRMTARLSWEENRGSFADPIAADNVQPPCTVLLSRPYAARGIVADYAARRTMPNGLVFPRIRGDRHVIGSA